VRNLAPPNQRYLRNNERSDDRSRASYVQLAAHLRCLGLALCLVPTATSFFRGRQDKGVSPWEGGVAGGMRWDCALRGTWRMEMERCRAATVLYELNWAHHSTQCGMPAHTPRSKLPAPDFFFLALAPSLSLSRLQAQDIHNRHIHTHRQQLADETAGPCGCGRRTNQQTVAERGK
jgi:hypothetical protein